MRSYCKINSTYHFLKPVSEEQENPIYPKYLLTYFPLLLPSLPLTSEGHLSLVKLKQYK